MSPAETANPALGLQQAVEAARDAAEHAARVRGQVAAEVEAALRRMALGTPGDRRVEDALSAQLARVANALARPPRRWVGMGEGRVLDAAEALSASVATLARGEAGVSAAAGEQLRKRQELSQGFRRLPDLSRAAEQSRRHLGRAFQRGAVAALAGRLTTTGRVLARFATGRAALKQLAGQLASLLPPLHRARAELGVFACRGRAVAVAAAAGRGREEIEIQVTPGGELMLAWDRHGAPRLSIYPAGEIAWRDGRTGWRLCFSLPRGDDDGRRLRIERPALATWTAEGHARLVRAGALEWEERTHPEAGFAKGGTT